MSSLDPTQQLPSSPANAAMADHWFHTVAGVMGNVLEWYDFALFGFFSDIIAQVFFPPSDDPDSNENLLKSFAIFGGAFVMRPVGGLLIGYVGDKHGRKQALTKSLFLMAIPTTLMGCLPTYETAGWLAIVLLVLCRLLQGISVGGQLPASLVYTVEQRDPAHWGYYGSLPMVAANCGTLLGNLCGASFRMIFTEEQLVSFAWRIPFFSGILIAFVAMYLRAHGDEVHTNQDVYDSDDSKVTNPLKMALAKENRLALLSTSLTPMLWGGGFYLSFVWMAIYMEDLLDPPVPNAFWVNACAMLLGMTFMLPLAGHFSDSFGRVKTMTFAAVGLTVLGPIMMLVIGTRNSFLAFLAQLVLGVLLSFFGAPMCAWMVETYSPEVRLTSASLGYDIAHATVAGFSPAVATALVEYVGIYSPGMLYTLFGCISLVGLYLNWCCGIAGVDQNTEDELELQTQRDRDIADEATGEPLPEIA